MTDDDRNITEQEKYGRLGVEAICSFMDDDVAARVLAVHLGHLIVVNARDHFCDDLEHGIAVERQGAMRDIEEGVAHGRGILDTAAAVIERNQHEPSAV